MEAAIRLKLRSVLKPPDHNEKPSKIVRFLSAWLGTFIWGLAAFHFMFKKDSSKLFDPEGFPTELCILLFVLSIAFALLIAASYKWGHPMRFFFRGLILSTAAWGILRLAFGHVDLQEFVK